MDVQVEQLVAMKVRRIQKTRNPNLRNQTVVNTYQVEEDSSGGCYGVAFK
jgi:hypothetical protein